MPTRRSLPPARASDSDGQLREGDTNSAVLRAPVPCHIHGAAR